MGFNNLQIELNQLPQAEQVQFNVLDSRYAPVCGLMMLFVGLLLALGAFIAMVKAVELNVIQLGALYSWLFGLLAITLLLILPVYVYLNRRKVRYALREHDLIKSSGLLEHNMIIQPLARLQHIELKRGPIDKYLNLASLKVFSAGTGFGTFVIPGLPLETAEQIRDIALAYSH